MGYEIWNDLLNGIKDLAQDQNKMLIFKLYQMYILKIYDTLSQSKIMRNEMPTMLSRTQFRSYLPTPPR